MAKLIDQLRQAKALEAPRWVRRDPKWVQEFQLHTIRIMDLIQDPDLPIIVADNVAEYYYTGSDQEQWNINLDFPNIAPPFPRFWVEFRMPKVINSKECGETRLDHFPSGRAGVLIVGVKGEDAKGEGLPIEAHWYLMCEQFIDFGLDYITGPHGTFFLAVDDKGRLIGNPWSQVNCMPGMEEHVANYVAWLHPALLAISFMHCRNVTVEEHVTPPKLAKRYAERHHGARPAKFHTLVLEPLKQILKTEGKSGKNGLQKAMHICRGHFKDYRDGAGLFGKYHQIVWHESRLRGKMPGGAKREIEIKL